MLFDKSLSEDEYGRDAFLVHRLSIIDGEHLRENASKHSLSLTSKAVIKNLATRLENQKEGHYSAETISENVEGLVAIEEMSQSMGDYYAVRRSLSNLEQILTQHRTCSPGSSKTNTAVSAVRSLRPSR